MAVLDIVERMSLEGANPELEAGMAQSATGATCRRQRERQTRCPTITPSPRPRVAAPTRPPPSLACAFLKAHTSFWRLALIRNRSGRKTGRLGTEEPESAAGSPGCRLAATTDGER